MNKYIKWGIIVVIVAGLAVMGIRAFTPKVNDEIKERPSAPKGKQNRDLNVKGIVLSETTISDEFFVSGSIIPDEEVDLSFETSGKVTDIFFKEGSKVSKGDLLAKINDAPLQAERKKLEAQLKLFTDRMYRQNALLEKEAVSQEAFQEAETNLATLQAEIDKVVANIEQTELRAPFDGIIGLRQVSQGPYASPTLVQCILPEMVNSELRYTPIPAGLYDTVLASPPKAPMAPPTATKRAVPFTSEVDAIEAS